MSLIRTIDNLEILEETINDTISDHLNNVRLKKMTIFDDFFSLKFYYRLVNNEDANVYPYCLDQESS